MELKSWYKWIASLLTIIYSEANILLNVTTGAPSITQDNADNTERLAFEWTTIPEEYSDISVNSTGTFEEFVPFNQSTISEKFQQHSTLVNDINATTIPSATENQLLSKTWSEPASLTAEVGSIPLSVVIKNISEEIMNVTEVFKKEKLINITGIFRQSNKLGNATFFTPTTMPTSTLSKSRTFFSDNKSMVTNIDNSTNSYNGIDRIHGNTTENVQQPTLTNETYMSTATNNYTGIDRIHGNNTKNVQQPTLTNETYMSTATNNYAGIDRIHGNNTENVQQPTLTNETYMSTAIQNYTGIDHIYEKTTENIQQSTLTNETFLSTATKNVQLFTNETYLSTITPSIVEQTITENWTESRDTESTSVRPKSLSTLDTAKTAISEHFQELTNKSVSTMPDYADKAMVSQNGDSVGTKNMSLVTERTLQVINTMETLLTDRATTQPESTIQQHIYDTKSKTAGINNDKTRISENRNEQTMRNTNVLISRNKTISYVAVWITVSFVVVLLVYIIGLVICNRQRTEWRLQMRRYVRFENGSEPDFEADRDCYNQNDCGTNIFNDKVTDDCG
ncbi:uncharacterized protein [Antedon mediterranea]|uniref:uncharacterized protein n=1 Tax=Antedon mediterranea TaxID=105859 RepID=UPI003AF71BA3